MQVVMKAAAGMKCTSLCQDLLSSVLDKVTWKQHLSYDEMKVLTAVLIVVTIAAPLTLTQSLILQQLRNPVMN